MNSRDNMLSDDNQYKCTTLINEKPEFAEPSKYKMTEGEQEVQSEQDDEVDEIREAN